MNRPHATDYPNARRRVRGDRAAVLTETAIIAPVFFLLVFGIIEFGLAFRDRLSIDSATQYGARMGAIQGDGLAADRELLRAAIHYVDIADSSENVRIVVFKATAPGDLPSSSCQAGIPVAGECNVYSMTSADDETDFGCAAGTLDLNWCPTSRDVTDVGADYVGVWIRAEHPFLTGLFGDTMVLTASTVTRIEPQVYS